MKMGAFKNQKTIIILFSIVICYSCGKISNNRLSEAGNDWPVYQGGKSSSHYSPLRQINRKNLSKLKVAWQYHSGEKDVRNLSQIQTNPLVIDGVLYGCSPGMKVFALNAATGERLWEFNPDINSEFLVHPFRGLAYWEEKDDKRLFFGAGSNLYSISARTGDLVKSFGNDGIVSLKEGLGERSKDSYVVLRTPGIVYKDLLIIGSALSETMGAAPGFIRAFNVRSGKLEWIFHTIPQPGEPGYETWPENAYKYAGAANCWAGMSLDEKRGIVYCPTGSAVYDFWGGNRRGEDLFADCLLALNAETGERIWHFQTVHHDIFDKDLPAPPNLVTVRQNGKKIDAVAQISKQGFVFLFDRQTGNPLFPIREIPVPPSDLTGEEAWSTQPVPDLPPPVVPQLFTKEEVTNISPESHDYVLKILETVRTGHIFIPPSVNGSVIFPGFDGGSEWGGAAVDPSSGVLYVNCNIMPWISKMIPIDVKQQKNMQSGLTSYLVSCATCHGQNMMGNASGTYPTLINIKNKFTKKEIEEIIISGKGFMPSFKQLDINKIEAIVAYITNEKSGQTLSAESAGDTNYIVPYTHDGYNRFFDQNGYPAIKPPWGNLSAVDLNEGKILWQVPLGEYRELTEKGIPKTGTENYGGPVVTSSGLIFIAASRDEYLRAFDKDTGQELWKFKLPAAGYATPCTYMANGKQYVVIACGGGKSGTHSGDSYMAFTLK
jgi:quinoprotein glucose dehydrogenase